MQWVVNLEKSVHEQNTVRLDGAGIQQNWLGGAGETIAVERIIMTSKWQSNNRPVEDRLNHDECLREVLPVQAAPIEDCFVRTIVEHLERGFKKLEDWRKSFLGSFMCFT